MLSLISIRFGSNEVRRLTRALDTIQQYVHLQIFLSWTVSLVQYTTVYFLNHHSICSFHYSISRDFIPFVLKHYGQSLQFGNKFIYQSMPRLLTIWLDFGSSVSDQGNVIRPYRWCYITRDIIAGSGLDLTVVMCFCSAAQVLVKSFSIGSQAYFN